MPSAAEIDRACRLGCEVCIGAERIAGAVSCRRVDDLPVQAAPGFVWVDVLPNYEWRQVPACDVIIHSASKGVVSKMSASQDSVTDLSRRRGQSRTNLGSGDGSPAAPDAELAGEEHTGQLRAPGMERVTNKKIEKKAWKVKESQDERMAAGETEKKLRQELTDLMVAENIENYPLDDEFEVVLKKTAKAYVRKRRKTEPEDE